LIVILASDYTLASAWKSAGAEYTDYRTNLVQYAIDKCHISPTAEQRKIFEAITPKDPYNFQIKELDLSGHNIGKTTCVGVAIGWFYECFKQSRTITTAPNFKKQVEKQSWAEVHKWNHHLKRAPNTRMLDTELKDEFDRSHYAVGVPSQDENEFRGFHEKTALMMIFEEGSGIEDRIYQASEGSQQHNYIFWIITNPGAPRGYVYDIAMGRKKGWNVQWFNSEEAELPDKRWIEQMKDDYGVDSPIYAVRVLGRFPDIGEDSVHSLSSIETATGERDENRVIPDFSEPDIFLVCTDVAEWGRDRTVITGTAIKLAKKGNIPQWAVITNCQYYTKQDVTFTQNEVIKRTEEWKEQFDNSPKVIASIDRLGVGSGAYSGIRRYLIDKRMKLKKDPGWRIVDFLGSRSAMQSDQYANTKAEAQFMLQAWLKAGVLYFSDKIDMTIRNFYKGDLLVFKYDYDGQGRYIVIDPRSSKASKKYDKEEKLDVRSPDFGDTLGQTAHLVKSRRGFRKHSTFRDLIDYQDENAQELEKVGGPAPRGSRITVGGLLGFN